MRVLVTGAFGNIGVSTLRELVRQGHQVRCFDLRTRANQRAARRFARQIEVRWGDIRRAEDVAAAIEGQEVAIHLAFIIPPLSETRPDWAYRINVEGTRHLVEVLQALSTPVRLILASSVAVYGPRQHLPPPCTAQDLPTPTDHYSHHKLACEEMVKHSGLRWAILRFAAAPSFSLRQIDPILFRIPLDNRIEFVHTRDVGLALANAVTCTDVWGRTLLIGGGQACQMRFSDYLGRVLDAVGIGRLPARAFGTAPFYTDWMDTRESQRLLHYQRHTYDEFVREMAAPLRPLRPLIRLCGPLIRLFLLRQSPYRHTTQA
jgi:UDP-glucose 4-epimerase